jgi:hypothetical protein
MTVWIVIVIPYMGVRYTDSMWAREPAALDRKAELETSWVHAGNGPAGHKTIIQPAKITDAVLSEPPASPAFQGGAL